MNNSKFKGKLSSALLASIGLVAIIVIWWLAVKFTEIGLLLPSPLDVLERIIYNCSHPIGLTVASIAGVILGIAMGRSKMIEAIFRPLFELVRPIPSVAWIPLAIVWFGIGESAKFYIIFMAGFVNIVVNTYSGAKQVDENMLGVAYMLGANKYQAFFRVVIPSCVPYIFAGMQVGLSTCWMAVLAAEMVSSTEGIGWAITAGQEAGDMTQIFVGIIAIAIVGLLLAALMRWLERILCQWRVRGS